MNEFFPTSELSEDDKEELLVELLGSLFYLPPSVMKKEGVEAKPFKIMAGEEAATFLFAQKDSVHGDCRLKYLDFARHVAISERSYKGETFYVYKLWHPGHPGNKQSISSLNQSTKKEINHE